MSQKVEAAPDPALQALAANLRRLRDQHDISRKEFARRVGASDRQVEHWELADSPPALRHLVLIGQLFRVPIESLLVDPVRSMEQHARYIRTHIDVLTVMTGASVILSFHDELDIRAVPDVSAPDQHSSVEVKGSITSRTDPFADTAIVRKTGDLDTILDTINGTTGVFEDPQVGDEGANPFSESLSEPPESGTVQN